MRPRKRRRNIFIPTGLVALILSLGIFSAFLAADPHARPTRTMEINLPREQYTGYVLRQHYPDRYLPNNRWKQFTLTRDAVADSALMEEFRMCVRAHVAAHDTADGITVHMGRATPYGVFVRIIDILNVEQEQRYAIEGEDLLVPPDPPNRPQTDQVPIWICGGVRYEPTGPSLSWSLIGATMREQFEFMRDQSALNAFLLCAAGSVGMFCMDVARIRGMGRRRLLRRGACGGASVATGATPRNDGGERGYAPSQ